MRAMFTFNMAAMQRLRFIMAILAVAGSMWAVVDLHQHQDGLTQTGACNVCSLETAVGNGPLTVAMSSLLSPAIISDRQPLQSERDCTSAAARIASIRAPPYS
ncbi:MAG: hypothetical protein COW18_07670 [Zetaproteobacteria bacterium CG12_big_fil_rev_8_21_14_0_65_54_13]|nr:MAG: hypothetical protein COW18_07670 [Zetaproteobacteria bacterium CG12_big_fil_rev_8_21_14_0_65_54_13]PIX55028.1 MAG: hypothetical protein COZ50_05045 [Zetaproteobacteria bacterium CG_4_10_14_3_um_filter_54_28]PJA28981.1 MAG: hypothetical protein CO188_07820 [Zetaproteobacteria bacterium CG_4_9_14_3_um_filter_54_145]